jgi:hypothetical protein
MEDLAIIVSLMLLTDVLFSLAVVVFAVLYRFRGKFKRTNMVLTALLAVLAGWLFSISIPLAAPAIVALISSLLFMYVPHRVTVKSKE